MDTSLEADTIKVALDGCAIGELVTFGRGLGVVTAIGEDVTIAVLRRDADARDVRRTGRFAEVPVGAALVGRMIDPLGAPLDGGRAFDDGPRRALAGRPIGVRDHTRPAGRVHTGIKAIDVCAPLIRGLVVAACGPDVRDVLAVCVRAQQGLAGRTIVAALAADPAPIAHATVVAAPPGSRRALIERAPMAAMAIAEDVRDRGGDALVVIDDLDRHAAALAAPTAAERYSAQAALFARAGRREPTRGGGSITVIAGRAAPPSPRPSPLDPLFAMDHAWTFEAPEPGRLAALVTPLGLSKYAPPGTAPALVPHSAAIRTALAHGLQLVANAIPRARAEEAYVQAERCRRLLDQPPEPVPLATLVALSVAMWSRALHDLPPDEAPAFERALVEYLADERPDVLSAIEPTRRLSEELAASLTEAALEVRARLAGN